MLLLASHSQPVGSLRRIFLTRAFCGGTMAADLREEAKTVVLGPQWGGGYPPRLLPPAPSCSADGAPASTPHWP